MSSGVLVLNAGSSSIKFALYSRVPRKPDLPRYRGEIEGIGHALHLMIRDEEGRAAADRAIAGGATHHDALAALLDWLSTHLQEIRVISAGHRVVHGGSIYTSPVRITAQVVSELERLVPLAPLHQPHNLEAIRALSKLYPQLDQIACFDTAFHVTQPALAAAFALPRTLTDKGVRRYGFHGLSYEYIASILPLHLGPDTDRKVIVAHLGQGASMCAMHRRQSVATTMGFSVLDGLVMGTRCGALDPGVILYLLQSERMSGDDIAELLYLKSGLKGVSGISDDMRDLLSSTDPRAREAVDLFVYRCARELGSLAAALGGLDALVFTGGIGEHSDEIRAEVCAGAEWLGVSLDEAANAAGGPRISRPESKVSVWALPTDEEAIVARQARALL